MSKLKVIQLLPELNIGGVERGTKDFSSALVQRGHESIVISNGGIFEHDIVKDGARHIKYQFIKKAYFHYYYLRSYELYMKRKNLILFM